MTSSIAAVERETGIGKDTLRVWERRYGFPQPERDARGKRLYPADQLVRLRLLRRLLDNGQRPGRVVGLGLEALQRLVQQLPGATAPPVNASGGESCLQQLRAHDVDGFRRYLWQAVAQRGLAGFVHDVVAPLNQKVGDAWMNGELQIFEEHLYTESVTAVLRQGLQTLPAGHLAGRPSVLLTTFPKEPHGLGLLMAETLLALEGCRCLSLGPQTPVSDIARATVACRADVVALSFSGSLHAGYVLTGLAELRQLLPPETEIWAGGRCAALHRKPVPGVVGIEALAGIAAQVQRWQQALA